jgi:formate C-acetyltransferase
VGVERAIHYTEFYKRHAGEHSSAALRNAHCLAYHLKRRSIRIHPGELIVGSHTEHRIGAICHIERAGVAMLEDVMRFEKRPVNPLRISAADKWKLVRNAIPYWLSRNLSMRAFPLREKIGYAREQLGAAHFVINEAGGVAHFLPDYGDVVALGTDGLRRRLEERRDRGDLDQEQLEYLEASSICLDALENFADRYRAEADRQGRADLVEVLDNVPRKPAGNLREALQLIWFFQMVIQIESIDQGISLGRIDQYLDELYRKEKSQDGFDADQIRDLFAAFCIKLSEVIPLFSSRSTEYFAGLPSGQALTLGGVDALGNDSANELSFLLLDVLDEFKTRQPNWHARISKNSSPDFVRRLVEIIAGGGGSPALYNDDVIMPAMARRGVEPGKAWNYATVGCVEPALSCESFTSSDAAIFNLAIGLELVLGGGRLMQGGDRCSRPWLDEIGSMDDLLSALEEQTQQRLENLKRALDAIETANADYFPTPFSSLTIGGCIENARDSTKGGAFYNASGVQAVGVADLANSLAVIEKLVFETKQYSLEDIANACATNFAGQELLRARARKIAAFGNGDPLTDELAGAVVSLFDRCVSRYTNTRGGRWMPGFYSMTCHQGFGKKMAALPSGRLAGTPLADGLAPVDGTDLLGPTASLGSIAKLDNEIFGNGINVNIKFDAQTVADAAGRASLEALVRGYFDQGGMQVQINVLDPAVLEDAMRNPDDHRNLLVRISGYCAYFVDLTTSMQQELIDRTRQHAQ